MRALLEFTKRHPARVYGVITALVALLAHFLPTLPVALVLGVFAAILLGGESVQRVENVKSDDAAEKAAVIGYSAGYHNAG